RRDVDQPQRAIQISFSPDFRNRSGYLFGTGLCCESVFIQGPTILQSASAQCHVVLLVSGEITEGKRELVICNDSQIGLDATRQEHAGFRFALSKHPVNLVMQKEMLDDPLRIFGRDQKIQVADCLSSPAKTSTCADLRDVWVTLKMVKEIIRPDLRV